MKKVILALAIVSVSFAACNNGEATTETPAADSVVAPAPAPDSIVVAVPDSIVVPVPPAQ